MGEHTPGPWQVDNVGIEGLEVFAWPAKEGAGHFVCHLFVTERNAEANASLIAASPDLLEAARELTRMLEGHSVSIDGVSAEAFHRILNKACDAIDKAEGVANG